MKKVSLFFAFLFLASLWESGFAQVKIINEAMTLEYEFKRCIGKGSNAFIDLVVTNVGNVDYKGIEFDGDQLVVYDDEGNVYKEYVFSDGHHMISEVAIAEKRKQPSTVDQWFQIYFDLPQEIPLKIRISIKGVDEYATMFKRLDVVIGRKKLSIRDIPITRE